jgi:hypothetical protein
MRHHPMLIEDMHAEYSGTNEEDDKGETYPCESAPQLGEVGHDRTGRGFSGNLKWEATPSSDGAYAYPRGRPYLPKNI